MFPKAKVARSVSYQIEHANFQRHIGSYYERALEMKRVCTGISIAFEDRREDMQCDVWQLVNDFKVRRVGPK
jgi:hypothetical protein